MIYQCPVCGATMMQHDRQLCCEKNHSFDLARSGYVNLLTAKHSTAGVHGDNKRMVAARRDFLERGYYAPLRDTICRAVCEYAKEDSVLLDAGCGEGYYTSAVSDKLAENGIGVSVYGVDISKTAVDFAAKRKRPVSLSVASVFHLPVQSGSCDLLLSVFSPYCGDEFQRVLRGGGIMLLVIPLQDHLWELKQAIYDTPYRNEVKPYELDGFSLVRRERIHTVLHLQSAADIQNLFSMTPYYYKTGRKEQERLNALTVLDTQAEFELLIYQRAE